MTTSNQAKTSRIEIRVSSEQKQMLEQAASLKGIGLSAYVLSLTLANAREEIAEHQKLTLSTKDWDIFTSALENPPEPNTSLKKAAAKFRQKFHK